MKFAVGYQLSEENEPDFVSIVQKYRSHISEVYFPWLDNASGRGSLADNNGYFDWSAQEKLIGDLLSFRRMGMKLDLLYNGNCYGKDAVSLHLKNQVHSVIDYLHHCECRPDIVTTASPAIAHFIKSTYPEIEVRASVNLQIGTVKGMEYLCDLFDSFYIQREYNRDLMRIAQLKEWADQNGKGLYLLANSGCMRHCSGQIFHDNMVSHNSEIERQVNVTDFLPYVCRRHLKDPKNYVSLLQNTWIRPEDLCHYEPYFSTVKLATRMHQLPELVIGSYARGVYFGNLLDLFEPGFGPMLAPYVFDNSKFPSDWFEKTTDCDKECHHCTYCESVLKQVLVRAE